MVAADETLAFEDKEYLVNLEGKRYRGFVMSMGDFATCNKILSNVTEYEVETTKRPYNKQPIPELPGSSNDFSCEMLKNVLDERDEFITRQKIELEEKQRRIDQMSLQILAFDEVISLSERSKLIHLSKLVFSLFASTDDIVELRVRNETTGTNTIILSSNHPSVRVPYHAKREADAEARNGRVSSTRLFRMLMGSMISSIQLPALRTQKQRDQILPVRRHLSNPFLRNQHQLARIS